MSDGWAERVQDKFEAMAPSLTDGAVLKITGYDLRMLLDRIHGLEAELNDDDALGVEREEGKNEGLAEAGEALAGILEWLDKDPDLLALTPLDLLQKLEELSDDLQGEGHDASTDH